MLRLNLCIEARGDCVRVECDSFVHVSHYTLEVLEHVDVRACMHTSFEAVSPNNCKEKYGFHEERAEDCQSYEPQSG